MYTGTWTVRHIYAYDTHSFIHIKYHVGTLVRTNVIYLVLFFSTPPQKTRSVFPEHKTRVQWRARHIQFSIILQQVAAVFVQVPVCAQRGTTRGNNILYT